MFYVICWIRSFCHKSEALPGESWHNDGQSFILFT